MKGDRRRATTYANEAVVIARETAPAFAGPSVLGVLAVVADDAATRRAARAEAEEILQQDCVGHNYLWFYRLAMDACLEDGDWDTVERYAAALEDYTQAEPLPWSDFYIARGRVLAAHGRGWHGAGLTTELERIAEEARRVGLLTALPALEAALAGESIAVARPTGT